MTPAAIISSLYFIIASTSSALGAGLPSASVSASALRMTMNRIVMLRSMEVRRVPSLPGHGGAGAQLLFLGTELGGELGTEVFGLEHLANLHFGLGRGHRAWDA